MPNNQLPPGWGSQSKNAKPNWAKNSNSPFQEKNNSVISENKAISEKATEQPAPKSEIVAEEKKIVSQKAVSHIDDTPSDTADIKKEATAAEPKENIFSRLKNTASAFPKKSFKQITDVATEKIAKKHEAVTKEKTVVPVEVVSPIDDVPCNTADTTEEVTAEETRENIASQSEDTASTASEKAVKPIINNETKSTDTNAKTKSKTTVIVVIVIIIIVAILAVLAYLYFSSKGKNAEGSTSETNTTTETTTVVTTASTTTTAPTTTAVTTTTTATQTTPEVTTTTITETTTTTVEATTTMPDAPPFEASEYVEQYFESENRIGIYVDAIEDDTMVCSLNYYSLLDSDYEYHTIITKLEGNAAVFSYSANSGGTVEGTFTFKDKSIIMSITKTDSSIEIGTYTFYLYREPNVWCPNCEYGFYADEAETENLVCPYCNYKFSDDDKYRMKNAGYYKEYDVISNGEHVIKDSYDGYVYLWSDGMASIGLSGDFIPCRWDIGVIYDESEPSDKIYFEVNDEFLTLYLDNVEWIFKKME